MLYKKRDKEALHTIQAKKASDIFFNQCFDKKRLKALIEWVFKEFGEEEALRVVEEFKTAGFQSATLSGISLGVHELTTPPEKALFLSKAQVAMNIAHHDFQGARITATERSQRIVDTWHRVSETLRKQVVEYFRHYDQYNPIYIMALSGARGNFSQVRQLVGMRGLMANPQGQIISFPIRSNLREGLSLTEYFISCSGARKGLVDTALRTADTGYLTRRLVDVSHHVVIKKVACTTHRGIFLRELQNNGQILCSLKDRLVGRVLAEHIHVNFTDTSVSGETEKQGASTLPTPFSASLKRWLQENKQIQKTYTSQKLPQKVHQSEMSLLAEKDQELSPDLAFFVSLARKQVFVRSPLTCALKNELCQLCYGWGLSQGNLVPLGEAVGVIAAQSIGEPGTQLTMRTFHTGGVFSGDLLQEIRAPHSGTIYFSQAFQGLLIRTTHGKIAFLAKTAGDILLVDSENRQNAEMEKHKNTNSSLPNIPKVRLTFQALSMLFVRQGERVEKNQLLAEISQYQGENNQPIRSQQTVFADISGKVLDIQGGSNKNQDIDGEDQEENKAHNYIETEKSGRLGLFQIISARIGATLHSYGDIQLESSLLQTGVHKSFPRYSLQQIREKGQPYITTQSQSIWAVAFATKRQMTNLRQHYISQSLSSFRPSRVRPSRQLWNFPNRDQALRTSQASGTVLTQTGYCLLAQEAIRKPLVPSLKKSLFLRKAAWAGTLKNSVQCKVLQKSRVFEEEQSALDLRKNIQSMEKSFSSDYNLSLFNFKPENARISTMCIPSIWLHPKLPTVLSSQRLRDVKQLSKSTLFNVDAASTHGTPFQSETLNLSFPRIKSRNVVKLLANNSFFLNTLAEEGDLVNENYKNYLPIKL